MLRYRMSSVVSRRGMMGHYHVHSGRPGSKQRGKYSMHWPHPCLWSCSLSGWGPWIGDQCCGSWTTFIAYVLAMFNDEMWVYCMSYESCVCELPVWHWRYLTSCWAAQRGRVKEQCHRSAALSIQGRFSSLLANMSFIIYFTSAIFVLIIPKKYVTIYKHIKDAWIGKWKTL